MQHFTHFGSFEASFGYVKQANKQLKKLNELQQTYTGKSGLGQRASSLASIQNPQYTNMTQDNLATELIGNRNKLKEVKDYYTDRPQLISGSFLSDNYLSMPRGQNRVHARRDAYIQSSGATVPPVVRKPKSSDDRFIPKRTPELIPDKNSFTDIRKVDDYAASPSGYLGYQKDPFKGYGGMMEEPVDMVAGNSRTPKARIRY
jgi:hypothetical protein